MAPKHILFCQMNMIHDTILTRAIDIVSVVRKENTIIFLLLLYFINKLISNLQ